MISAYEDDFPTTEQPRIKALLDGTTCPRYRHNGIYANHRATFELMRTWSDYGLISFDTHGETFSRAVYDAASNTVDIKGWGDNSLRAKTFLYLRGGAETADLAKKDVRRALSTGAVLHATIEIDGVYENELFVTEKFFKNWVNPLPDSLVYLSTCRGARTGDIVHRLFKKGARTVLGYTDYVQVGFARKQGERFFNCMLADPLNPATLPTSRTCYVWDKEKDKDPAEFVIYPKKSDMRLVGTTELVNGDFEQGHRYWETTGDARFVTKFGAAQPTGKKMALISTGLGFSKGLGSISQMMCLNNSFLSKLKF